MDDLLAQRERPLAVVQVEPDPVVRVLELADVRHRPGHLDARLGLVAVLGDRFHACVELRAVEPVDVRRERRRDRLGVAVRGGGGGLVVAGFERGQERPARPRPSGP